ncbi:MAG: hypothetical protein M1817_006610 [Caeruleum heppii]|nr:MAG: hypothetical protein M1817_006610 [Caeruleum heppii]
MADKSNGRRRSSAFFPRSTSTSLAPSNADRSGESVLKKKRRPASSLGPLTSINPAPSSPSEKPEFPDSPKTRQKTLLKGSARPTSLFGSLRMYHSVEEEEKQPALPKSKASSLDDVDDNEKHYPAGRTVLHHGEVQTTGGMFRKRKEYLVLTDTHLLRFKNQSRASEAFIAIPSSSSARTNANRHSSMNSMGSLQDAATLHTHSSAEYHSGIPLQQIVAIYKLEDGRPYFSIEVAYLDEDTNQASSMALQLFDPREADLWLTSIRATSTKARLLDPIPFPQRNVEYVARKLERERDYHPAQFRIFKVVQRASIKSSGRGSSDDLTKLTSSICYLVFGIHKMHLIPLPKSPQRSSSTALYESSSSTASFGLMTLTSISVKCVDAFELTFREPLRRYTNLFLASSAVEDIAVGIRQATEYLRPEWIEQPFTFDAPQNWENAVIPPTSEPDEHRYFDRTLTAYAAAYDVDTSNIQYAVYYDVEDAPRFALLPPANPRGLPYTALELLAILRALRYNESFRSISFRGVTLDVLHQQRDLHGGDHVPWTTRSGQTFELSKGLGQKSLLVQEVRALALKNKKLRRLDFAFSMKRKPIDEEENGPRDPGCEIVEALFPLCRKQLTNVDWITLSGIELAELDLDYLVDAAVERACHLRALEISRCGLSDRSLQLILNAMLSQDSTLESIDISGNDARLTPSTFQGQIGHFGFIRKLNLSRVQKTQEPEPLVAPETLVTWRLEELHMSETTVNEQTVDAIAEYLATPMSDTLRVLNLNQSGLSGKQVAVLMRSMSRGPGLPRNLHLYVSENKLEAGNAALCDAIESSHTPSHLTMKMIEFQKESRFRALIHAVRRNTTLRYLDISKTSLPGDAKEETCEQMRLMFEENRMLEELDISGEHAHLEVAKFGIGLNHALTGLKNNTALRVLRIEYQKLGFQGANTLSSVLEANHGLREIHCSHNDINLQGMTVLLNGLAKNTTVLHLPRIDHDRLGSIQTVEREIHSMTNDGTSSATTTGGPSGGGGSNGTAVGNLMNNPRAMSLRRTFTAVVQGPKATPVPAKPAYSEQDINAAVALMNEQWDREIARLERYLGRNIDLASGPGRSASAGADVNGHGRSVETLDRQKTPTATSSSSPPSTLGLGLDGSSSLSNILEQVARDTTPKVERADPLDELGRKHFVEGNGSSTATGEGG